MSLPIQILLSGLIMYAMFTDIKKREISNTLCISVLVLACAHFYLTAYLSWSLEKNSTLLNSNLATAIGLKEAALVLGIGFAFYLLKVCGAGDVKFMAALVLFFPGSLVDFAVITAIVGGILGILVFLLNLFRSKKIQDLPYGVAIGSAALCLSLTM